MSAVIESPASSRPLLRVTVPNKGSLSEEAAEVWMAAEYQSKEQAATEISQLLYQLQVLMLALDLDLDDIYRRL